MKTLGITTWSKIKVGEVFAEFHSDNYIYILLKINNKKENSVFICGNNGYYNYYISNYSCRPWRGLELYKLPIAVQRLWIEWE